MKVTFANNEGSGGVEEKNVPEGTTVEKFLRSYMPRFSDSRHQARVNRAQAGPKDILEDGDHVAIMPLKVGGGV